MINTPQNEMAFVGGLYKNPIEVINYYRTVNPDDFFTEKVTKFFYNQFKQYYEKFLKLAKNMDITEKQFTIFISEHKETFQEYKDLGGWNIIERMKNVADEDKIPAYFESLKKYALMRKLEEKGFPVEKLLKHKKFPELSADDIIHAYNYNLSQIMCNITKEQSLVDIVQDISVIIEKYCETPYLGTPFKFQKYTDYFLGMNKGDMMISLADSNFGKSRKSVSMIADLVFLKNRRVGMFDNEMSISKTRNCLITTICNDPDFGYCMNKPEREIKLGIYKDDNEKKKIIDIARFIESKKGLFYFKEMYKFTDEDLDMEIRKAVLGLDCEFIFYGTLKGYGKGQGDWATLKTTVSRLKSLMGELKTFGHCSAQLAMDAIKLDIFEVDASNIAESRGIVQLVDFAVIDKEITGKTLSQAVGVRNGKTYTLDQNKRWCGCKVIKNREDKKPILVSEYNLDLNIWGQYDLLKMEF